MQRRNKGNRRLLRRVGATALPAMFTLVNALPVTESIHGEQRRDAAIRMRRVRIRAEPQAKPRRSLNDKQLDEGSSAGAGSSHSPVVHQVPAAEVGYDFDKGVGTSKDMRILQHREDTGAAPPVPPSAEHSYSDPLTANTKGKERETHEEPTAHSTTNPIRRQARQSRPRKERTLRFTSQRSPFHSAEVGPLASRQPAAISVGLFRPDYPYLPSGRRKVRDADMHVRNGKHGYSNDVRAEKMPFESIYTVPEDVVNGNILKKGWTRWMLDDDMRLAVPDDARQPRRETAVSIAKKMVGRKWYRWKAGEGYVLSRYKDYSIYENGPGIALGQLLPPRERPTVGQLPFIPNDSKRDLVWLIVLWLFILTALAFVAEVRSHVRALRKGKRRSAEVVPSIRIFQDGGGGGGGSGRLSSFGSGSLGLRTRQRTQARNFREMCKSALFPNATSGRRRLTQLDGAGQDGRKGKGGSRVGNATTMAMRNLRWVASSASATIGSAGVGGHHSDGSGGVGDKDGVRNGFAHLDMRSTNNREHDVLPTTIHHSSNKQRKSDDGHQSTDEMYAGKLLRRGRSSSPYISAGAAQQTHHDEWDTSREGLVSVSSSSTSNESMTSNGHVHASPVSTAHHHQHNGGLSSSKLSLSSPTGKTNGFALPYPAKEA